MKNLFDKEVAGEIINRVGQLNVNTTGKWGEMNVAQMLAHCNVAFEMAYENKHSKPKGIRKFLLKKFVKPIVVGEKPFAKNGRTAPAFLIADSRDFSREKDRLISYVKKTQELGADYFDGRESHSFGKLTSKEWNNMFYKHIDHHLQQFGV